jgi:K+-transporting ATPase A subunit
MHSSPAIADQRQVFVMFLVSIICIVGGLTFLAALSLGPIAEQAITQARRT